MKYIYKKNGIETTTWRGMSFNNKIAKKLKNEQYGIFNKRS